MVKIKNNSYLNKDIIDGIYSGNNIDIDKNTRNMRVFVFILTI